MLKKANVLCRIIFAIILGSLICQARVFAIEFSFGEIEGNLDSTVSVGVSWRVENRDYNLIGKANQPEFVNDPFKYDNVKDKAYKDQFGVVNDGTNEVPSGLWSQNGDDGDLNFDKGVISELVKVTSDLSFKYQDFGLFLRGMFFYDVYLMSESDDMRVDIMDNEDAKDQIGRGVDLLDAFLYYNSYIGQIPFTLRVGRQVINWGESAYIPHGISESNPIDVSKLRSPGAELKEAFIPVGSIWTSVGISETINFEAFYQLEFERMIADPPGSYFSTNDFIGDGGNWIQSSFQYPDLKPDFDNPIQQEVGIYRSTTKARYVDGIADLNNKNQFPYQFNHVCERLEDQDASDSGQYGFKISWFAEQLNYTEFGFYYLNYHSRRPLISGYVHDGFTEEAINDLILLLELQQKLPPGVTSQYLLSLDFENKRQFVAGGLNVNVNDFFQTGDVYGPDSDFAGHTRDGWIHGYVEYPEDIKLLGFSFNTVLPNGMSVAGEYSYRMDEPLQIDDVEMIMALSSPIYDMLLATGNPYLNQAGVNDDGTHRYYSQHPEANEVGEAISGEYLYGYKRFDVSQAQISFAQVFSDFMGASKMSALAEFGYVYIHDMPEQEELRFDALGTVRSGNPTHRNTLGDGVDGFFSNVFSTLEYGSFGYVPEGVETNEFGTAFSWGYRLMTQLNYNNIFAGVNLTPKITFAHDVYGNTPVPIATFMQNRKSASLNLNFDYQRKWSLDIGGRMFFGAGSANRLADRDYIWMTMKYSI